ncbi:ABC transporter permease [Beijerinckia sp. L45]|uniref:ABC transporter permease n=1 Tax=Beijerinckia sp. L45 TaxID=1641855 RepID=UPI00131A6227|nr:ABC transporter permease [Beijerinckia sp. L45]
MLNFLVSWLADVPDSAAAYALAALGLIISERAGVLNLTAEGLMLVGAMSGIGAALTFGGQPELALLVAMVAAAVISLLFAMMVVVLRVNQVISGLAIVFFCQGLTNLVGNLAGWQNKPVVGLLHVHIPWLSDLPVVGRILFSQNLVIYLTIPIFILVSYALRNSMAGLRLRAVGENPEAADAAGISVATTRFLAIAGGSALIGLAGGLLAVGGVKVWVADITGGRGWIAVALVIFARWQPWRALAGALLFGCIESLIPRIAAAGIQAPQYFMLMLPYIITLAVMVWSSLSKRATSEEPGALGRAFVREERR